MHLSTYPLSAHQHKPSRNYQIQTSASFERDRASFWDENDSSLQQMSYALSRGRIEEVCRLVLSGIQMAEVELAEIELA